MDWTLNDLSEVVRLGNVMYAISIFIAFLISIPAAFFITSKIRLIAPLFTAIVVLIMPVLFKDVSLWVSGIVGAIPGIIIGCILLLLINAISRIGGFLRSMGLD